MIDYRENNKWMVYIHISPSNKYYVGITSRKPNERWRNGKGYIKNQYFFRAIQKYGWNNFQHEIFAEHLTKTEVCEMEKFLIKQLKSNDYHFGYNICSGGEGTTGLFGEKNPNYGKRWNEQQRQRRREFLKEHPTTHTEESKKKISESSKRLWQNLDYRNSHTGVNAPTYGRTGEKHPMYGLRGKLNPNSKQVICTTTYTVYPSTREASEDTGANRSKLSMCCRGERKSSGKDKNGKPLQWKYYNDYLKENNLTDDEARKSLFFIE